jgi:hypothetical protein
MRWQRDRFSVAGTSYFLTDQVWTGELPLAFEPLTHQKRIPCCHRYIRTLGQCPFVASCVCVSAFLVSELAAIASTVR